MSDDALVRVIANPASGATSAASSPARRSSATPTRRAWSSACSPGSARAASSACSCCPPPTGCRRRCTATCTRAAPARRSPAPGRFPALQELDVALDGTARDSAIAVERMVAAGVRAIVVLGGDGTHRVVARACGDVPLCALSTGTNNAFPEMRETTVAGIATALVATGRAGPDALRREARSRSRCRGLHVRLASGPDDAARTVHVALAPGLVVGVQVAAHRVVELDERVETAAGPGTVALDGEREIERRRDEPVTVRMVRGPLTIDVDAVMRSAAANATPAQLPPS